MKNYDFEILIVDKCFQLQESLADYDSSQSWQPHSVYSASSSPPVLNSSEANEENILENSIFGDNKQQFKETIVNGETYCLVPKELVKFLPMSGTHVEVFDGIGAVEVSDEFLYIPASLIPELQQMLSCSVDLQKEVKLLRDHLWKTYGGADTTPSI